MAGFRRWWPVLELVIESITEHSFCDIHGRTWFPPSCLFVLSSQLLELRGEVESSFLVEQPFYGQVALRDCASIRWKTSFFDERIV